MKRAGLVVGLLVSIAVGSVAEAQGPQDKAVFPISVSASCHDGNRPAQAVDGNLGTRWSCLGDGQSLTFEVPFDYYGGIGIAFWQNGKKQRTSMFDVYVSTGFDPPQAALVGAVSPATEAFTFYPFTLPDGIPLFGSIITIVGHGNSQNGWNSILELEIYAKIVD